MDELCSMFYLLFCSHCRLQLILSLFCNFVYQLPSSRSLNEKKATWVILPIDVFIRPQSLSLPSGAELYYWYMYELKGNYWKILFISHLCQGILIGLVNQMYNSCSNIQPLFADGSTSIHVNLEEHSTWLARQTDHVHALFACLCSTLKITREIVWHNWQTFFGWLGAGIMTRGAKWLELSHLGGAFCLQNVPQSEAKSQLKSQK